MEQKSISSSLLFSILSCLLVIVLLFSFSGPVEAYKNYTVGDSLGWYDNLEKPNVNYQKWVAGKNFSLGDFLIFNTDYNHTVIQTYNFNTYKRCDYANALDNDTVQWSSPAPSATSPGQGVSVAVPLLKVGMTFFFSSDYDGKQCKNGQRFKINVTYGEGLPESLKSPSEEAPAPNAADVGNEDSAPDTVVPSNFNNPHGSSDVREESGSISLEVFLSLSGSKLNRIFILLGLICIF